PHPPVECPVTHDALALKAERRNVYIVPALARLTELPFKHLAERIRHYSAELALAAGTLVALRFAHRCLRICCTRCLLTRYLDAIRVIVQPRSYKRSILSRR